LKGVNLGVSKPAVNMKMDTERKQKKGKDRQIQVWIYPVFGCLITLVGIISIILALSQSDVDFNTTLIQAGLWCFLIGIPSIILGILNISHMSRKTKRQIRGWLLAVVGILCVTIGIYSFISQLDLTINGNWVIYLSSSLPPLIIGIWLFIIGIREIVHKENIPTPNIDSY
jgi:uncharacterized membrane protein HdeD (DUF308 family)